MVSLELDFSVYQCIQDVKSSLLMIASMMLVIRSEIKFRSAIACSFYSSFKDLWNKYMCTTRH
jgi:hypothetical protein